MMAASQREEGVSTVELIISMALLSIVAVLAMTALTGGMRLLGQTQDETQGLDDNRVVVERLGRDLRAARGVDPANSDASQLAIWIDNNADYKQTSDETIVWSLQPNPDGEHYDLVRETLSGVRSVVGSSLYSGLAFKYTSTSGSTSAVPSAETRSVEVEVTYDAFVERFRSERTSTFDIRMRNVL